MTKTERKAIEKLALSAYAAHLYEGLVIRGNYTLGEAIKYWREAKEDVGAIAPRIYKADVDVFALLDDYKHNVQCLENEIAARVSDAAKCADFGRTSNEDRVEISAAQFPEVFEVVAFPGKPLRICRSFSYVDSDGQVQLYLMGADSSASFCKTTPQELCRALRD